MRVFITALAIAAGLFVLAGYFFPPLMALQIRLKISPIDWAIIIAGMATLVGIVNLAAVQMEKFRTRQKGGMYGLLLVFSLLGTFGLGLFLGPGDPYVRMFAVEAIIVPVEASLMAILVVTLIYASIRLWRRRLDVTSVVFLLVAVVFLIALVPTPSTAITPLQDFIAQAGRLVSAAGARGLLIGIALGTLLTGLRVLFGVDRPYGGN